MARKRDDTVKLVLRLPPLLHRKLRRVARENNQSLNSEMISRLEQSFSSLEQGEALTRAARKAMLDLGKELFERYGVVMEDKAQSKDDGEKK